MANEGLQICPKCGGRPQQIDRVREPVSVSVGDAMPEAEIIERALCARGHRWLARDEPADGDIVVQRKAGVSTCAFGLVIERGVMPADLKLGTHDDAQQFAKKWQLETGGRVFEMDVD